MVQASNKTMQHYTIQVAALLIRRAQKPFWDQFIKKDKSESEHFAAIALWQELTGLMTTVNTVHCLDKRMKIIQFEHCRSSPSRE